MRSKFGDNEPQDVSYHGNAFLRLMGYIKPYWKTVALCCVLAVSYTHLTLPTKA